jgi:hypothetical protein
VVASNFAKNNGVVSQVAMTLVRPFQISEAKGALTSIYLASSPEVAETSGQYFDKCKPVKSSAVSYDVAAQEALWALSERMTGLA